MGLVDVDLHSAMIECDVCVYYLSVENNHIDDEEITM